MLHAEYTLPRIKIETLISQTKEEKRNTYNQYKQLTLVSSETKANGFLPVRRDVVDT